jgi:hypothetical protein
MTIYIYRNDDGRQVDAIEGSDSTDCERVAEGKWGTRNYHWSFNNAPISKPAKGGPEVTKRGIGEDPLKRPGGSSR